MSCLPSLHLVLEISADVRREGRILLFDFQGAETVLQNPCVTLSIFL
jgi:hypothetical protein